MSGSIADLPEQHREYLRGVYERTKARLDAVVAAHGVKPGLARAVAIERIAILDAELEPVFAGMAAAGTPVACAKGCVYCCTTTVPVSPDEVFALVDYLQSSLSADAWAALQTRARAADARGHGMASVERHQLCMLCPVLDPASGACLGHAVRPIACQGYLSIDVARCEADYADTPRRIPHPAAAAMLANIVDDTRADALAEVGLTTAALELTAALIAAVDDPGAEARWLSGAQVLAQAPYIPSRPEDIARMARERGEGP